MTYKVDLLQNWDLTLDFIGYKFSSAGSLVFGLIDYYSGMFFTKLWRDALTQNLTRISSGKAGKTTKPIILVQDGQGIIHRGYEVLFWQFKERLSVYQLPATPPILNLLKSYGKILKKMKSICIISQPLILSNKKLNKLFCILLIDKRIYLDFMKN